ncbi:MAG: DASS family sodium-coupled anion symporter [Bacteroidota bacterium]
MGLFLGVLTFIIVSNLPVPAGLTELGLKAAAVALLMTFWWVTEAIPIAATAMVPLVLFPTTGVLSASETAENYGHNYVVMLIGGFILAKAFEVHNLHKRIALLIMQLIGTSRKLIILSFMLATALLSMWIANVAITLLMLPIALAIISKEKESEGSISNFGLALMLAIAYSASIGGTGTLIGTPPNMVFAGMVEQLFPKAPEVSFFQWMLLGLPLMVVFLPIIWIYLTGYFKIKGAFLGGREVIEKELISLGKMGKAEKRVAIIFILTALGWIFRRDFVFDAVVIPGWASLFGVAEYVHDSTVALTAAVLLFVLPSGKGNQERLIDWKTAERIPWGVPFIVGGGYSIANGFAVTGLAAWLGNQLAFIGNFPLLVVLLFVILLMTFLTEINSNTATANIFLPVLASMSVAGESHPFLLMIPATVACSFAFMLPSGTGTNAVIFGSGIVSIPQMARCGLWLNLISIILLTIMMYLVAVPIFDISSGLPEWVKP